jgi:hypothetical protein
MEWLIYHMLVHRPSTLEVQKVSELRGAYKAPDQCHMLASSHVALIVHLRHCLLLQKEKKFQVPNRLTMTHLTEFICIAFISQFDCPLSIFVTFTKVHLYL